MTNNKNAKSHIDSVRSALTVTTNTLRELCSAGITDLFVEGQRTGGFVVRIRYGSPEQPTDKWLGTSRRKIRRFGSLDTVAALLQGINVREFGVNVSDYQPGRIRAPRPDRAEALRLTGSSRRGVSLGETKGAAK